LSRLGAVREGGREEGRREGGRKGGRAGGREGGREKGRVTSSLTSRLSVRPPQDIRSIQPSSPSPASLPPSLILLNWPSIHQGLANLIQVMASLGHDPGTSLPPSLVSLTLFSPPSPLPPSSLPLSASLTLPSRPSTLPPSLPDQAAVSWRALWTRACTEGPSTPWRSR